MILHLLNDELNVEKLRSCTHIQEQFEKVAHILLNEFILVISGKQYRLFEIEFYYHSPIHPDPFVHRHSQQLTRGRWYFHKKGFISLSGICRGVDLSFGDKTTKTYGGILIRGIVNPENQKDYVYGPAKCVNYFRKNLNIILEETDNRIATEKKCPQLFLREAKLPKESVMSGPRVGLTVRTGENLSHMFRYKHYRYLTFPRLPHRGKEVLIIPGLLVKGWTMDDINRTFGYRKKGVMNRAS
jgi:hypothetical protein